MASVVKSTENEWSHEVGHNWMGHYTGGFGGAVHSPSNHSGCAWGYDMKRRRFIQNFNKKNTGEEKCCDQCADAACRPAYLGKYSWRKGAMSGGSGPRWKELSLYSLYTPRETMQIQEKLEEKFLYDPSSPTGARKWKRKTKQMDVYDMSKKPILFGVETTLIVGFYEYDQTRGLQSYIYPALHSAYGFVYDADGVSATDIDSDGCGLVVKTNNNGDLVYMLSSEAGNHNDESNDVLGWMNELRVNVATAWDPYEAQVYCYNNLLATRTLLPPRRQLLYTVNGEIPDGLTGSPTKSPSKSPTNSPSAKQSAMPSLSTEPTVIPTEVPSKNPSNCDTSCTFPPQSGLANPYIIKGKVNLKKFFYNEETEEDIIDGSKLSELFYSNDLSGKDGVKISCRTGASRKNIYLPPATNVPSCSVIEIYTEASKEVTVHYYDNFNKESVSKELLGKDDPKLLQLVAIHGDILSWVDKSVYDYIACSKTPQPRKRKIPINPTPVSPTRAPTSKTCAKKTKNFAIEFMTDWNSISQNQIFIRTRKGGTFEMIKNFQKKSFPINELFTFDMCLDQSKCHVFVIKDKKKDGIGKGWYNVYWGGKKLKHKAFKSGKFQKVFFGKCNKKWTSN